MSAKEEEASKSEGKKKESTPGKKPTEKPPKLSSKLNGELGLVSTVLGCRENRDRIELAQDFKDFLERQAKKDAEEEKKTGEEANISKL